MGGTDGRAMEFGSDIARTRAAEEGAGKQWFLTPFSVQGTTVRKCAVGGADGDAGEFGYDRARPRATDEGIGEQWFLTPLSVSREVLSGRRTRTRSEMAETKLREQ